MNPLTSQFDISQRLRSSGRGSSVLVQGSLISLVLLIVLVLVIIGQPFGGS